MMDMFAMTLLEAIVFIQLERTATSVAILALVSASGILLATGTA